MVWGWKSTKSTIGSSEAATRSSGENPGDENALNEQARSPEKTILENKIGLSRWTIVFEQIWPRVWLIMGVMGIFVLVSLLGLWSQLPFRAHQFTLAIFGLALFLALLSFFQIKWPGRDMALRRIEKNSDVPHRPASSYEDQLSMDGDDETSLIWSAHKKRLSKLLSKLRVGGPRPRVDAVDPLALRALLTISLATLLVITGSNAPGRIMAAFDFSDENNSSLAARVDAWVTPPRFTGRAPIMLIDGNAALLTDEHRANIYEVPERSLLVVRVAGKDAPRFVLEAVRGENVSERLKPATMNESGDLAEFRFSLDETVTIKLSKSSHEAFSWNFNVEADADPKISLIGKPSLSVRGALKLAYKVSDDFGVASASASFELVGDEDEAASGAAAKIAASGKTSDPDPDPYRAVFDEPLKYPLKLAKRNARKTKGKTFKDVSSHPWAGLPVRMTLQAIDQAKQTGRSRPLVFKLPARSFTKPMAKAVVEQRRNLVKDPHKHQRVAKALDALTIAPERFIPDKQVYLAMRSAYWRLKNAPSLSNVKSVFDQLWDIALRIEDGDLSAAERALRTAQDNLQNALQENASNEEIQKLMKELRQAMSQFMKALARQQAKNGNPPPAQSDQGQNKMLTAKDLDQMMRNIEKMLQSGSREAAQQMLSQLQELMEQMQSGNSKGGNQQSQQMMRSAEELGKLIGKQQKLLDDTFRKKRESGQQGQQGQRGRQGRQGQQGQQGQQGRLGRQGQQGQQGQGQQGQQPGGQQPGGTQLGSRQGQLRGALNQLMEGMRGMGGQAPKELGGAGQSMQSAEGALGQNDLGRATRQQIRALDQLRKGTQKLVEQAMKGMGRRMGKNGRDPLGRAQQAQGPDLGASVKVPDEIDVQKAREILEELRRRLSDPSRPSTELDYIERLLRRF